jgi:F-type H+-transporting ATPase subunit a
MVCPCYCRNDLEKHVMASGYNSPSDYIEHHLKNLTVTMDNGWSIHVDTVVNSLVLGFITFGILWLVARKATSGVPGRLQSCIELLVEFIDNQVKDIYHGSRNFVTPLAITVFVWVLVMNSVKLIPIDWLALVTHLFAPYWRPVPTTDLNTTAALSLSVIFLVIVFSIKAKGVGGYIHELFCTPFGSNPILWPFNFAFQLIELISKPLSLALRLYGNMFAGEVIFLLIGMLGVAGIGGVIVGSLLQAGWAIFHILVVALQAFIFMMLTVVYLSMAKEHH